MSLKAESTSPDTQRITRARIDWLGERVRSWSDDASLESSLAPSSADIVEMLGNAEFGAQIRDMVGLPVEDPLAWANREIRVGEDDWAVASIRFRRRDISKPFVDVAASSLPPTLDALGGIADAVMPEFAAFSPLCMRITAPDPRRLLAGIDGGAFEHSSSVDQWIVAGLVDDLRRRPRAARYDDVRLEPVTAEEAAPAVRAMYESPQAVRPESSQWAAPASADELEPCEEERTLFAALLDGERIGVVAVAREADHGLTGFCVQEIVLDAAHRGQGLAAAMEQRLVDELAAAPHSDSDTLWGTIHPDNAPSLRTALSVGREIVGGYVWLTPSGYPSMPAK